LRPIRCSQPKKRFLQSSQLPAGTCDHYRIPGWGSRCKCRQRSTGGGKLRLEHPGGIAERVGMTRAEQGSLPCSCISGSL
jgi:hypothetical protein